MNFLSDFADQALMLPLAVIVPVAVACLGWWRAAGAWLLGVGGTLAVMLVLKSGFVILTGMFGSDYILSPSGHVAAAWVIYGGMSLILFKGLLPGPVIAFLPILVAGAVGYSRLELGAHTLIEVVIGAVVGGVGYGAMAARIGPWPRLATWPVAAVAGCTMLALHGLHMPAEAAIRSASSGW